MPKSSMQPFKKIMVLITVILMNILAGMEFDLFVPSFPELQQDFSLTPFWVEALLSANFVGYALSLFFVGGAADRYGRKPIIMMGLITFAIGSILCICALSFHLLIMGRFLQGVGIAAPSILAFIIIADEYPLKQQQFYLAMLNGLMNASVAAAPVVGSYITFYFHWQGNFKLLLMLSLIALVMATLFIPRYKLPEKPQSISLRGYFPLFQSKHLRLLLVNIIISLLPYWIFVGMSPLLYIKDLGVSLKYFGYYQGVLALVFALGSVLYGLAIHRTDQRKMLILSGMLWLVSLILIVFITVQNSTNPLMITLSILPFVIGQIVPAVILYPLSINLLPHAKGRASAVIQGGRLVFSGIGVQIAGYFYVGSVRNVGIIIACCVLPSIITLWMIVNNRELMQLATGTPDTGRQKAI